MTLEHLDTVLSFVAILSGVSLLITTMTQLASATLGLRGSNLRWGVRTLLSEIEPALRPYATEISERVLHHPLISDSSMSMFKTRLMTRWKLASAVRKEELIEVLHRLATPTGEDAAAAGEPWQAALKTAFDRLDREAAERMMLAVRSSLTGAVPPGAHPPVADMMEDAETLSRGIRQWFDPVMDRVSQRFALHTRAWTVAFAFVLAFGLHLDSLAILNQLSSSPDVRTRLLASADTLANRSAALSTGSVDVPAGDEVKAVQSAASSLRTLLDDQFKLHLIPDPYPQPFYAYWKPSWLHLAGILSSALLLSLGAPFWFNMLKTLTNLRPVVARRVEKEGQ